MSPKGSGKNRLIIISAPSGAGKTTLCELLLKDFPNITLSISTTTRSKRPYETEGTHYNFLTREEFQTKIQNHEFAEWAEVHGKLYGTPKQNIDKATQEGKHLLFDIDVQGAMKLLELYSKRSLLIFILPPSLEILRDRLQKRKGDSPGAIETRIENAYNELQWSPKFDYQIKNDNLEKAYQQLKQIIQRECL